MKIKFTVGVVFCSRFSIPNWKKTKKVCSLLIIIIQMSKLVPLFAISDLSFILGLAVSFLIFQLYFVGQRVSIALVQL